MNFPKPLAYPGHRVTAKSGQAACAAPPSPHYFPLSARQATAARAWLEEDDPSACCQMKTAASVIYIREGHGGLETFLTYRTTSGSPLGRVSFPGGVVEPDDHEPVGWYGPTPTQWATKLGHDDVVAARSAVVAAIRESFEEVGVLLAGPTEQDTVEYTEASETMASREAIAGHELGFIDYLKRAGLKVRTDLLKPIGRWQTPDFSHRRYDTHFFASVVPVGQRPKLLTSKGVWGRWVSPEDLVANPSSTELGDEIGLEDTVGKTIPELVTPGTLFLLKAIAACPTTIAFLTKKRRVHVKKPELVEKDGQLMLAFDPPRDAVKTRDKGA
ncbi:NUDIX hydrolase [Curtobacterium sp. S6]|uniref:NUDIX hydrolase n=1 Tax=Curtobacterium sp. S6 TaxID=1479623 RepID=UPI001F208DD5|nr:NUDIX hydrolase [Curtobacterium sp. S6]